MSRIRELAFKLRGGVWTLLFFVMLFLAHPTFYSLLLGLPFVVTGQLLRFWAVGCISRYRGEKVGAVTLATWGPYAFVRNPLYVGNGLIGLGWGLMCGPLATLLFFLVFLFLYVILIVPHEESFLTHKFGSDYLAYKEKTGAFFPRSWPAGRIHGPFDKKVLWASERHSLLTAVVGTLLITLKTLL